nr:hypothetical protein [Tanacetum cinerariifolium]
MLEKDMYDSWKRQMVLYMMNRQHGRMILESIENGPLIWPTIEENGVTRPKKYSELSATEAIQADYDYGSPYQSLQHGSHAQSLTPLLITNPSNDFQSSVHHNVYNLSSSIPQAKYAPSVHQQSDFSQPDFGLIFLVFQKGDDPIDAINHMMSFLTAVITSRYPPTNNQLRNSSNPRQQATINNGRVTIALMANLSHYGSDNLAEVHNPENVTNNVINQAVQAMPILEQSNIMNQSETKITSDSNIIPYSQYVSESQYTAVQNSNFPAQQDALILSVIEQLKTQVVNCTKINQDNKSVNETLTAELERYKDQVRILKEGNNADKVSDSYAQSMEIDNLKQTLS